MHVWNVLQRNKTLYLTIKAFIENDAYNNVRFINCIFSQRIGVITFDEKGSN